MLKQTPIVTIITPSYNQGHFIRATIESVLSQDYPNVEYIIMDGGSTDETASVVKDYASRVTFISEKDRGQSHAINKGFQMAKGSVLAWLNSDDLYLPGCIRTAVDGFGSNPAAGALYGEGYLIDHSGKTTGRFPCTEPFNLWKLAYLSDYILQQTVYFRKEALDDVGLLDENLHYTMDWDVLIRIGMKYELAYVPEYMGCLREYPAAKTSAGGMRRTREIRDMLQRHTGMRISPGYIVYGLDTWRELACQRLNKMSPPGLKPVFEKLGYGVRRAAGVIVGRTIAHSQGLYSDGWAGNRLLYMLPPASEPVLIKGTLPEYDGLYGQRLYVSANGTKLGAFDIPFGKFSLEVSPAAEQDNRPLRLEITALRSFTPARLSTRGDRRSLAYQLDSIRRADRADKSVALVAVSA